VPFDGDNPVAVAMQHLHAHPVPIQRLAPDVPPAVVQVCMKAMEKNPENRYQSARDMASDLRAALDTRMERNPARNDQEVRQPKPHLRDDKSKANTGRQTAQNPSAVRIRNMVLTVVLAACVVAGLFFATQAIYRQVMTSSKVPEVIGMTLAEANQILEREGLKGNPVYVSSEDYEKDTVFLQNPAAESTTRKGDTVLLTVSSGPAPVPMPDVMYVSYSEALSTLKAAQITQITVERVARSDYAVDTVLGQNPEPKTPISRDTPVTLSVCGGEIVVPTFSGMTLEEAEQTAMNSNLTLSPVLQYVDTELEEEHGRIAAQTPDAGNKVIQNTTISLSLYRCAALEPYTEVEVTIPASETDTTVRITVQAEQSGMEYEDVSYIWPADADRTRTIRISEPDDRVYICTIYVDGVQMQRLTLNKNGEQPAE